MTDDLVLTPAEASEMLRISEVTVRRLVRTGYLPRLAGVRLVLIPTAAVDRYLRGEYDDPTDGSREGHRDRGQGHSTRDMAQHYAPRSEAQDRLAAEALGRAIG